MYKASFRFLWIGQSLANSGDVFYMVGLIAIIHGLTGSVTYMALVPFFITISRFFSGMLAPLVIERVPLKSLLAYSQLGKTLVILFLGCYTEFAPSSSTMFLVFLFVIIISFLDGWANPARNSLVPIFIEKDSLVKANSFLAIIDQTISLGGWAVGGVLVAFIGDKNVIWLTLILYAIASIMMFLIKNVDNESINDKNQNHTSIGDKLKEGWLTIWHNPSLRIISIVEFLESIANVVWVAAIMYVYVDQILQTNEQWWGYINASFFAGLMIGGSISLKWPYLINNFVSTVIIVGAFGASITTLMFSLVSTPWISLIIALLFGVLNQIKDVAQQTSVQKSVIHRLLPKVYSAKDTIITATFGISSLLLGNLTDIVGVKFVFLLSAIILLISAIFVLLNRKNLSLINTNKIE
ncbi:MFS transporter [Staphylococcus haemolyticus]|uniref:MFS transporter n=1 Tax=Staphylococcus haemolyticus TaxID=1283 RepID=UPI001F56773C|nr:MFS transporter [Staphylococcus haemolyticus]MCI2933032.1 MFS transporter [Staphylococcus haemolyticus]